MPKVSIIILTYNRAAMLRSAIASALGQTFQDFEIIVVDDASRDHTQEVVSSVSDKRIQYLRHDVNKGEARARNTGVAHANGEYIAFLDDDDEWLPDKLGLQVDVLEKGPPEVGVVYTGGLRIDKTKGNVESIRIPTKRGDVSRELLKENFIIMSSTLVRKVCFEKVGLFDANVVFGPDYDMWIRISKCYEFEYIKEPMVKYYLHGDRLTTNFNVVIKGIEVLLEKYGKDFALDAKYHSRRYYRLGLVYCLNRDGKRSREACLEAIKANPFAIKCYLLFLFSLFGANGLRNILRLYLKIKANSSVVIWGGHR